MVIDTTCRDVHIYPTVINCLILLNIYVSCGAPALKEVFYGIGHHRSGCAYPVHIRQSASPPALSPTEETVRGKDDDRANKKYVERRSFIVTAAIQRRHDGTD